MIKYIPGLFFLLKAFCTYSQDDVSWKSRINRSNRWANEVNKLVGPKYVLLEDGYSYSLYEEVDLDKDGKSEIIVSVTDTSDSETKNKIFVFTILGGSLKLIDSSARYEMDGRGPRIQIQNDSLIYEHSFHRGHSIMVYKFDIKSNRYKLIQVEYFALERFKATPGWNEYWSFSEIYNVASQKLIVESENNNEGRKEKVGSKRKVLVKPLPKKVSIWLSGLLDPNDADEFTPLLDIGKSLYKYFEY